jgi:hypothetical protein
MIAQVTGNTETQVTVASYGVCVCVGGDSCLALGFLHLDHSYAIGL